MSKNSLTLVPLTWSNDTLRLAYRGLELDSLLQELIRTLPEPTRAEWETRRRGVDVVVRLRYYSPTVRQHDNGDSSGNIKITSGDAKMGEEE